MNNTLLHTGLYTGAQQHSDLTKFKNSCNADLEREKTAQTAWRKLCASGEDAFTALWLWRTTYPGIVPEPFKTGNQNIDYRYNRRQARDAIYGKKRKGKRSGGFVGRGRVLIEESFQHRVISLSIIRELRHLELDASLQFDATKMALVKKVLGKYLPDLCCVFVHHSLIEKKNHVHILCRKASTDLGSNCRICEDTGLMGLVGYLMRKPDFTTEVALAYIQAKRASHKRALPSRFFNKGCSPRGVRTGLEAIESVFGSLTPKRPFVRAERQQKAVETPMLLAKPEQLVHAVLPLLRDATPECLELVGRLHQAWIQGTYEGRPAKVGAAKTDNLAHALRYYFARKWLVPGEVFDLEQLALSLDLQVVELTPKTDAAYPFVTRRNISPVLAAVQN